MKRCLVISVTKTPLYRQGKEFVLQEESSFLSSKDRGFFKVPLDSPPSTVEKRTSFPFVSRFLITTNKIIPQLK